MATVYLARDLKHDRQVALKVLRPELAAALGPERFLREIQIAANLSHPHILPLFDSGQETGDQGRRLLFYVMPFVEGESLRDRLTRDGPLPVGDAIEIARQVLSALAYAHGQGIIHRDIKPENILLQAGQAVVSDFGIARAIDAAADPGQGGLTETGMALGTPRYMSPEQIAGDRVTGSSDVYSLGCVLYEMLAGRPPFDGPTAHSVLGRHTVEPPPSPRAGRPEVSRSLERTVLTSLAKQPADRFGSAEHMADALAGDGPPGPRRWRPSGRIAGLAGLLVAVAFGAAWWVRQAASGSPPASLAVLYLDNRSRDSSDQHLADGITEEMIWRLGRVERLTVTSRGTVAQYRGEPAADPAALGPALDVSYLVSGSLERAGPTLRIRVELVETASGRQVWNAQFDATAGDLLAIEDSVAQAVAGEVIGRLAPAEVAVLTAGPTDNPEAYIHYLKGNLYLSRRTSEADGRRALEEYEAALALEPRFPAALSRLGLVYGIYASWPWPYPGLTRDSLVARGLAAANRAIALDSTNADGWLARGFLLTPAPSDADARDGFRVAPSLLLTGVQCWSGVSGCLPEAEAALARAVRLDPKNAENWYQYARTLGFSPAGDSALRRSLELEPDRAVSAWLLGWRQLSRRNLARAATMLDSAIALGRRDLSIYGLRLETRLAMGDTRGAVEDLNRIEPLVGGDSVAAAYYGAMRVAVAAKLGDSAAARARADSLERRFPPSRVDRATIRIAVAAGLVAAGEFDRGLAILEGVPIATSYPPGHRSVLWDPVRDHPRFRRYQARLDERPD